MIVIKPTFVNMNYENIYDTDLISLEWNFVLDTIQEHCKDFEYDRADGFKLWWWAVHDEEDANALDRTCLLNINGIEPTDQIINRFKCISAEKEIDINHPYYNPEYNMLQLRFEVCV